MAEETSNQQTNGSTPDNHKHEWVECDDCRGYGSHIISHDWGEEEDCSHCGGTGKVCKICGIPYKEID